ncbi:Decaheme cytochrome c MtrA [hydrothermal vent metagenome]|uniref:Decaheme cytochrome c MtrA n=1 Tax=hydrothermal vent metagenome TaxID=652676 RepID=A0A3B0VM79_9ZZZZ
MAQINCCDLVKRLIQISLLIIIVTSLQAGDDFTRKGADSCLKCHDEESEFPVLSIFKTKHASKVDKDSPFASAQCETCHGPGKDHGRAQKKGKDDSPMLTFGKTAQTPAIKQNEICLGCHKTHTQLAWEGSIHAEEDVACASCHQVHIPRDRVFNAELQQQTCFSCHPKTKAELHRASTHPLRFGKMTCTDCHNPHDSNNDSLLTRSTINDTCYDCHAEKRGPFLWEHAPVSEDCTLCHNPHGSNHQAMLKQRTPLLCQQCHAPSGHPTTAYTSENATSSFQSRFILGRSCLNCHSQVHGSNHPSGATITR